MAFLNGLASLTGLETNRNSNRRRGITPYDDCMV